MACSKSLVKYILFVFNIIMSVIGILSIVYGVQIFKSIGSIAVNGQEGFPVQALMPIVLVNLGWIMVLTSFLGWCGALRGSPLMTMIHAVFLLSLLILQLTLVVLMFTKKDQIDTAMGEVIDTAWKWDQGAVDVIQKSLHCCGRDSAEDYHVGDQSLPASCCEGSCLNPLNIYGGCRTKFVDLMSISTVKAKSLAIGLLGVELIGFILASCQWIAM